MTFRKPLDDPLRWQAFRYVSDELDRDERAAFEARLGDDPDACAAVAEAVELLACCLALESPTSAGRGSRRVWVGPAVALAAAAAIVLAMLPIVGEPGGRDDAIAVEETIALEHAWSQLRRSGHFDEGNDPSVESIGGPLDAWDGESIDEHSAPPADEEEGLDPPSWLMAAVALDDRTTEGRPGPLEN